MQLINKDIKNIKELKNFLKDKKAISDSILDVINSFKIKKITNFLDSIKRCGVRAASIVFTLLLLPFANVFSIRAMYMSGLFNLKEGKDIFYDLKKNIKVDWRKL